MCTVRTACLYVGYQFHEKHQIFAQGLHRNLEKLLHMSKPKSML